MSKKKDMTRFGIRFNPAIESHRKAIKFLNEISERGKADHIATALLMYNDMLHLVNTDNIDEYNIEFPDIETTKKTSKPIDKKTETKINEIKITTVDDTDDTEDTDDFNDAIEEDELSEEEEIFSDILKKQLMNLDNKIN